MRFVLAAMLLLALQPNNTPRLRVLVRDESDSAVANATLQFRVETGKAFALTTDATGVAVSDSFAGNAVVLLGGTQANGQALVADSYPAGSGFRLVLIPGQVRDVLLRLDGDRIVLDPDMIFSPGDPGERVPQMPAQLAAPVVASTITDAPATTVESPISRLDTPANSVWAIEVVTVPWIVVGLVLAGLTLSAAALLIGFARRRQQ